MKQRDVKIGETYACRVGPNLCNVVVVAKREQSTGRTVFLVRRTDDDRILPKGRTAAALRLATKRGGREARPSTAGIEDNERKS